MDSRLPRGNRMPAMLAANFNLAHLDFVGPTYVFHNRNDGYALNIRVYPLLLWFGVCIRHRDREPLRKRRAYPVVSENALGLSRLTLA